MTARLSRQRPRPRAPPATGQRHSDDTAAFDRRLSPLRQNGLGTGQDARGKPVHVNDGNNGSNYAVTFATTHHGIRCRAGHHGHRGHQHQGLRRHDLFGGHAGDHRRQPGHAATRRPSRETFDTKNAGTGKTLTAAGSVNDGNSGSNYAVTFATNTTGQITRAGDHRHRGGQHQGLRRHDLLAGHADDHRRQPGRRRHGGLQRDLRHQERGHGQDAHRGRLGQRRQRRQQLHGDLCHQHHRVDRGAGDHRHRGHQHQGLRRHNLFDGHADDHRRQPGRRGDTAAFSESFDTKNAGTGKTLTAAGSVNDGNGGNNYTVTFVTNTTGSITARAITVTAATSTKGYDGTTSSTATPTITAAAWPPATRRPLRETFDTKNAGTGKTLTAAGSVNDGNSGSNYTVTFAANTTGSITARAITVTAATTPRATTARRPAAATPTITAGSLVSGDTAGLHRDLRHQERGHGQDARAGRLRQRRQRRQQLRGDLRRQHHRIGSRRGRSPSRRPPTPRSTTTTTSATAMPTVTAGSLATGDTAAFSESYDTPDRGHGQDAHAGRLGQRRQRRQQLRGDLRRQHDRRDHCGDTTDGHRRQHVAGFGCLRHGGRLHGHRHRPKRQHRTQPGQRRFLRHHDRPRPGSGIFGSSSGHRSPPGPSRPAPRPSMSPRRHHHRHLYAGHGLRRQPARCRRRSRRGRSRSRRPPAPRVTTARRPRRPRRRSAAAPGRRRHGGLHRELRHQERGRRARRSRRPARSTTATAATTTR